MRKRLAFFVFAELAGAVEAWRGREAAERSEVDRRVTLFMWNNPLSNKSVKPRSGRFDGPELARMDTAPAPVLIYTRTFLPPRIAGFTPAVAAGCLRSIAFTTTARM